MLIQIVVLYMVYMFNLPEWCRWFVWVSMAFKCIKFMCDIYKAGETVGNEK